MKSMFESSQTFEAYAEIDYCYYCLEQLNNELQKPRKPIEILIDQQTGFDKKRNEDTKKQATKLLKHIIKCKKKIEADYSGDEKFLEEINDSCNRERKTANH